MSKHYSDSDPLLVEKYSTRKGSFYTFYPAVGDWREDCRQSFYDRALDDLAQNRSDAPLSLYLHFPFCPKQCLFCHCFTVISRDAEMYTRFIDSIIEEVAMFAAECEKRGYKPNFREVHFGGGSPSVISEPDFDRLIDALSGLIDFRSLNECAIEIDPRNGMSVDRLHYYADKGINRISFGIQDFNPLVQKTIARVHSIEQIAALLPDDVRRRFRSVNFDLIYGLPHQTREMFRETLKATLSLDPDRLAVYTFGYRPDLYRHQAAFAAEDVAGPLLRADMHIDAVNMLMAAGYETIGIDHYAKPDNDLSVAKAQGTLFRNAIGYTPGLSTDIIAVGPSSMSTIGKYYFQNFYTMPEYYKSVAGGSLPLVRGFESDDDDMLRRHVIFDILLYNRVSKTEISAKYGIEFDSYFRLEIADLAEFENDGLAINEPGQILLTDTGRFFQRQICALFDSYARHGGYRHSREFSDGRRAFERRVQMAK